MGTEAQASAAGSGAGGVALAGSSKPAGSMSQSQRSRKGGTGTSRSKQNAAIVAAAANAAAPSIGKARRHGSDPARKSGAPRPRLARSTKRCGPAALTPTRTLRSSNEEVRASVTTKAVAQCLSYSVPPGASLSPEAAAAAAAAEPPAQLRLSVPRSSSSSQINPRTVSKTDRSRKGTSPGSSCPLSSAGRLLRPVRPTTCAASIRANAACTSPSTPATATATGRSPNSRRPCPNKDTMGRRSSRVAAGKISSDKRQQQQQQKPSTVGQQRAQPTRAAAAVAVARFASSRRTEELFEQAEREEEDERYQDARRRSRPKEQQQQQQREQQREQQHKMDAKDSREQAQARGRAQKQEDSRLRGGTPQRQEQERAKQADPKSTLYKEGQRKQQVKQRQQQEQRQRQRQRDEEANGSEFVSGLVESLSEGCGGGEASANPDRQGVASRAMPAAIAAPLERVWTAIGAAYFQDPLVVKDIVASLLIENGDVKRPEPAPTTSLGRGGEGFHCAAPCSGGQSLPYWAMVNGDGSTSGIGRGGSRTRREDDGAGSCSSSSSSSSSSGSNSSCVSSSSRGAVRSTSKVRTGCREQVTTEGSNVGKTTSGDVCGWETPMHARGLRGWPVGGKRRAWTCTKGVSLPVAAADAGRRERVVEEPPRVERSTCSDIFCDAIAIDSRTAGVSSPADTPASQPCAARTPAGATVDVAIMSERSQPGAEGDLEGRLLETVASGHSNADDDAGSMSDDIVGAPTAPVDRYVSELSASSVEQSDSGSDDVPGANAGVSLPDASLGSACDPPAPPLVGSPQILRGSVGLSAEPMKAWGRHAGFPSSLAPMSLSALAVSATPNGATGGEAEGHLAERCPGRRADASGNDLGADPGRGMIADESRGLARTYHSANMGPASHQAIMAETGPSQPLGETSSPSETKLAGAAMAIEFPAVAVADVVRQHVMSQQTVGGVRLARNGVSCASKPTVWPPGMMRAPLSGASRVFDSVADFPALESVTNATGVLPAVGIVPAPEFSILGTPVGRRHAGFTETGSPNPAFCYQSPLRQPSPNVRESPTRAGVGIGHGRGASLGKLFGSGCPRAAGRDEVSSRLASVAEALSLLEDVAILPALYRVSDALTVDLEWRATSKAENIAANRIERAWRSFCRTGSSGRPCSKRRPKACCSASSVTSSSLGGALRRYIGRRGRSSALDVVPARCDRGQLQEEDGGEADAEDRAEDSLCARPNKRRRCVRGRRPKRKRGNGNISSSGSGNGSCSGSPARSSTPSEFSSGEDLDDSHPVPSRSRRRIARKTERCTGASEAQAASSGASPAPTGAGPASALPDSAAPTVKGSRIRSRLRVSIPLGEAPATDELEVGRTSRRRSRSNAAFAERSCARSGRDVSGSTVSSSCGRDASDIAGRSAERPAAGRVMGWVKAMKPRRKLSGECGKSTSSISQGLAFGSSATSTDAGSGSSSSSGDSASGGRGIVGRRRYRENGNEKPAGRRRHTCREFTCSRKAHFGSPGWVPAHCEEHRRDWEVLLKFACCLSEGCLERPHFGVPGDLSRVYCRRHRVPGAVGLASTGWKVPEGLHGDNGGWVEAEEDGMGVPVDEETDAQAERDAAAEALEEEAADAEEAVIAAPPPAGGGGERAVVTDAATSTSTATEYAAGHVAQTSKATTAMFDKPAVSDAPVQDAQAVVDTAEDASAPKPPIASTVALVPPSSPAIVEISVQVSAGATTNVPAGDKSTAPMAKDGHPKKRGRHIREVGVRGVTVVREHASRERVAGMQAVTRLKGARKEEGDSREKEGRKTSHPCERHGAKPSVTADREEPETDRFREKPENDHSGGSDLDDRGGSSNSGSSSGSDSSDSSSDDGEDIVDDPAFAPGRFAFLVPSKKCDRPILVGKIIPASEAEGAAPASSRSLSPAPPSVPVASATALLLAKAAALLGRTAESAGAGISAAVGESEQEPSPQAAEAAAPVDNDEKRWIHVHWHTPASLHRKDYCRGPFTPDFVRKEGSKSGGWDPFVTKIRKRSVRVTCPGLLASRCIPAEALKELGV